MTRYANLGAAFREPPDSPRAAIIDLSGEAPRTYTYAQLQQLCQAAARGFVRKGLRRGNAVAIAAGNRTGFLVAVFGALQAGLVPVPVNHKLPAPAIAALVEDAGACLAVCDAACEPLLPPAVPRVRFDDPGPEGFEALLDAGTFDAVQPRPGEVGLVIYTSGSTGRPKGVMFSHLGHLWALDQRTNAQSPAGETTLVAAPLYHQNGLASCQAALGSGGTVVLLPGFDPARFIEAIARHRVTMVTAVPTMIAMIARERAALDGADLGSVRIVRVSSAPSTPELIAQAMRIFPRAKVVNGYGTTEGGPVFFAPHPQGLPQPAMSVGCAHPEVRLRLVRDGEAVQDQGVLQIRSPALMLGYRNLPEASARAFTADGFYDTGDIFRRDADGFFYFVSRADDMFTCGGENIFPSAVEAVLLAHPQVDEACVVAVPDALKGHKPVAFVVPKSAALTEDELKRHALERAPAYQHPRRVWFLDALPLASTNKVDRRQLALRAAERLSHLNEPQP
ncbi:MAG: class I adenylate-forming enzyme family protein [Rubrivivax sp.]